MATLFPVMVNVGISRGAAAAICASPAAIILSPTSGDVDTHSHNGDNRDRQRGFKGEVDKRHFGCFRRQHNFAFKTTLPISIVAIVGMGIAHFFWQRYLDKKENISHETAFAASTTSPDVGERIMAAGEAQIAAAAPRLIPTLRLPGGHYSLPDVR
jgi:DcuC family C4-dicarboxylate transporter